MVVLVVAGAALLGMIVGCYVRAVSDGFGSDRFGSHRFGSDRFGVALAPDDAADDERGTSAIAETRRGEARRAFRGALSKPPVLVWPPTIEAATGVVCGLIAWRYSDELGSTQELALMAACLYAGIAGMALAVIDWRTKRLPDAITLPSYLVVIALLVPSGELLHGVYGMMALGGIYALLWFARPGALGLGDVKLAGMIGLVTGAVSLDGWVTGAVGGHLLGAAYAVVLLVSRKGTLKSEFPFGPFMLAAGLAGILLPY